MGREFAKLFLVGSCVWSARVTLRRFTTSHAEFITQQHHQKPVMKAGCVTKREQGLTAQGQQGSKLSKERVKRVKLPKVGIDHTTPYGGAT